MNSAGRSAKHELIVEDDPAPAGQRLEGLEVVVGGAGAAVQAQQRRPVSRADVVVPDLAARDIDIAFAHGPHILSYRASTEAADWQRTGVMKGFPAGGNKLFHSNGAIKRGTISGSGAFEQAGSRG